MFSQLKNFAHKAQEVEQELENKGIIQGHHHHDQSGTAGAPASAQPDFISTILQNLPLNVQNYQQQLQAQLSRGEPTTTQDGQQVQLSSCLGRKKAVFVGINYFGTANELHGCINDVNNVRNFVFQQYGFTQQNSLVLTDDQKDPKFIPTKNNILQALQWLVQGAQPGDSLFLHYSGHGGTVPNTSGDESSGNDETIIPLDYEKAGFILDDELHTILISNLPAGVRLTAIFDSCHSGSVLDLPFTYNVDGSLAITVVDNRKEAVKDFVLAGIDYFKGDTAGALSKAKAGFGHLIAGQTSPAPNQAQLEAAQMKKSSPADVIQWGGCLDTQTSADATLDGKPSGAMSYAFIKALNGSKDRTYTDMLRTTRQILTDGGFTQVPQLSTGHKMDINVPFVM